MIRENLYNEDSPGRGDTGMRAIHHGLHGEGPVRAAGNGGGPNGVGRVGCCMQSDVQADQRMVEEGEAHDPDAAGTERAACGIHL